MLSVKNQVFEPMNQRKDSNLETKHLMNKTPLLNRTPLLLCLLTLNAVDLLGAAYSGAHVSSTMPSSVPLGAKISFVTTVRNNGTDAWDSFDQPGWILKIIDLSWKPGLTITHYVWTDVASGSESTETRELSGTELPTAPGTYQLRFYAYAPDDDWSGDYSLMSGSPKTIQFTVTSANLVAPTIQGFSVNGANFSITLSNLVSGANVEILHTPSLTSANWQVIDQFTSSGVAANRVLGLANAARIGFFRARLQR